MANPRIDGIYELGHVLYALDTDAHGFTRGQIARVERYWTFSDMHSSSAGFVLVLHDGRRACIDFRHWHGFEQEEDFRIEVDFLADGEAEPDLPSPPADGWSFDTAHLDRTLGDTAPG
jgi:hypothetical protein